MRQQLTFLTLLSTTFFLVMGVTSCDKEILGKKDYHLDQAKEIVSQYNAGRADWDQTSIIVGNVKFAVADKEIYIITDVEGSKDMVTYFLQADKNSHTLKSQNIGEAEIIFLDEFLVINSLEKELLVMFSLTTPETPEYLKNIQFTDSYQGFGIGKQTQKRGISPRAAPTCKCRTEGQSHSHCDSGGSGASSCSTSNAEGSCSVTCDTNNWKYACCDNEGG